MKNDFIQSSYQLHAADEEHMTLGSCITNPQCIDAWRHRRMIDFIDPILAAYPGSSFMTVGDGRYGADAYLLRQKNVDVLSTSLTDQYLKIAHEQGYINKYMAVNAENIPLNDDSVDFVVCKESFHHFPRPAIAFYEMLRVARRGVILIEPSDDGIGLLDFIKRPVKKILRKEPYDYEPCGNYVFRPSSRELKKMLKAINKPYFAVKHFNDFYFNRVANSKSKWSSGGFLLTRIMICTLNVFSFLKLMRFGKAAIIAFKTNINGACINSLKHYGFRLAKLPGNPYVGIN